MLSVTAVISTYCFVESPSGLAQVVWLDLESSEDEDVEAWVEGAGWRARFTGRAGSPPAPPSAPRSRSWSRRATGR